MFSSWGQVSFSSSLRAHVLWKKWKPLTAAVNSSNFSELHIKNQSLKSYENLTLYLYGFVCFVFEYFKTFKVFDSNVVLNAANLSRTLLHCKCYNVFIVPWCCFFFLKLQACHSLKIEKKENNLNQVQKFKFRWKFC